MTAGNRLFSFTRNDELLIGSEVIKASRAKEAVRRLQREKQMVEDWRLDIYCRNPHIVTGMEVRPIEPDTALGTGWKYGISLVMAPTSRCIGTYTLTVAWFRSEVKAVAMIETVQAYMSLRYGV